MNFEHNLSRFTPILGFFELLSLETYVRTNICILPLPKCCSSLMVGLFTRAAIVSSLKKTVVLAIASPVIFLQNFARLCFMLYIIYPEF